MNTKNYFVSVAIPATKIDDYLKNCLDSIYCQEYLPDEVIVVTNDASHELDNHYTNCKIIKTNIKGISFARNEALKIAKGDIIIYTDSDCRVDVRWIENLVKIFVDETIAGVVGSVVMEIDDSLVSVFKHVDISTRYKNQHRNKATATGLNCAYKKNVLLNLGGFNTKISRCEDAELSYRILEKGYKIISEQTAIVYHIPEKGLRKFLVRQFNNSRGITNAIVSHINVGIQDNFISLNTKIQIPLIIFLFFLIPYQLFFKNIIIIYLSLIFFCFTLGIPLSYKVFRVSKKPHYFFSALLLYFLRGISWSIGSIIGFIDLLINISHKCILNLKKNQILNI